MSGEMFSKYSPDAILSPNTDREIDRIRREAELIEQRDRQPIVESDRGLPLETPIDTTIVNENFEPDMHDAFWEGLIAALKRKLE